MISHLVSGRTDLCTWHAAPILVALLLIIAVVPGRVLLTPVFSWPTFPGSDSCNEWELQMFPGNAASVRYISTNTPGPRKVATFKLEWTVATRWCQIQPKMWESASIPESPLGESSSIIFVIFSLQYWEFLDFTYLVIVEFSLLWFEIEKKNPERRTLRFCGWLQILLRRKTICGVLKQNLRLEI